MQTSPVGPLLPLRLLSPARFPRGRIISTLRGTGIVVIIIFLLALTLALFVRSVLLLLGLR
jgi:hypothetical protein